MTSFKNEMMLGDPKKKKTTTVDSVCKEKTHHDAYEYVGNISVQQQVYSTSSLVSYKIF